LIPEIVKSINITVKLMKTF